MNASETCSLSRRRQLNDDSDLDYLHPPGAANRAAESAGGQASVGVAAAHDQGQKDGVCAGVRCRPKRVHACTPLPLACAIATAIRNPAAIGWMLSVRAYKRDSCDVGPLADAKREST